MPRTSKGQAQHATCQAAVDAVKAQYETENQRYRAALELIARGVWIAPNSVETMVYAARRALTPD